MIRILALDPGEKRVGVAVSDPLGLTAQPLTVLARKPHGKFMDSLALIIKDYEINFILLGLPLRPSGEKGPEAQKSLSLAYELKQRFGLPLETWDEWKTTVEAEKILLEADLSRIKRKRVIDKMAATLLLESYLPHYKLKLDTKSD